MQKNHNLAYLTSVSKKYLKEATKKLEVKDYSLLKEEQAIINKFEKALKELESANVALKDLAIKIKEKRFLRVAMKVILKFLNHWIQKIKN
ncbi:hypothetical protein IA940_03940 [Listeria marthii]|uniref:hypothetical protein n=1 Tax=Listeria marthii TaxID=529731 RepID=UPI0016252700|nr:hypothetical protein [Listeria marthii]MBC2084415.1 hypothetical protein [Listeria marthii]MBF2515713.1 hypothetical protein [Listeria marthii]MBF2519071.1 hypothetical protein [Listeria marthii]